MSHGLKCPTCLCNTLQASFLEGIGHAVTGATQAVTCVCYVVTGVQWNVLTDVCVCVCVLQELLLRLVEDYYPLPSNPSQDAPTCPTAQASQAPTHSQLNGSTTLPSSKSGRSAVKLDKKRKRGKAVMEVVSPRSRRTKKSVKAGKGIEEVAVKAHMTSDVIPEADSGKQAAFFESRHGLVAVALSCMRLSPRGIQVNSRGRNTLLHFA